MLARASWKRRRDFGPDTWKEEELRGFVPLKSTIYLLKNPKGINNNDPYIPLSKEEFVLYVLGGSSATCSKSRGSYMVTTYGPSINRGHLLFFPV